MTKLRNIISKLQEEYTIPISIGATVLMGKFKNKSVVVKSIEMNEKGDLLINGKVATKWRMFKKAGEIPQSPFDEEVNKFNKDGKDGGEYRKYKAPKKI